MRQTKQILTAMTVLIMGAGLLAGCGSSSSQPTAAPAVDGATLMSQRCTVCHTTDRIKAAMKTKDEWTTTVTRMIGHGAKLSDTEKPILIDYLAQTYHP